VSQEAAEGLLSWFCAIEQCEDAGAGSIERCSYDAEPDPAKFQVSVIEDNALLRW
jgi:hypothetical protein